MGDKRMCIPDNDTQNYPCCRLNLWLKQLNTQLNESTNQNSPKLLSQQIRKRYYKTLRTTVRAAHCPLSLSL